MVEEDAASDPVLTPRPWKTRPAEFEQRASRPIDVAAESEAVGALLEALADGSDDVLQMLAAALLRLSGAHSAGVSILEAQDDREAIHWRAVAGRLSSLVGMKMRPEVTPCGAAIQHRQALFVVDVERVYSEQVGSVDAEWLTVPFFVAGVARGTLWLAVHEPDASLGGNALRTATSLARVAATAERLALAEAADASLRTRARELESVMELVPAVVFVAEDAEARSIRTNRAGRELLGLSPSDNASKSAGTQAPTSFKVYRNGVEVPADKLPVQLAARGHVIEDYEEDIVYDDGTVRHWIGAATPLRDDSGTPAGAVAAFIDITERKRAEQALKEADRHKDEFLATLAHELRNPLAPLRNALQMLALDSHSPAAVEKCRAIMERQVAHMVRLIDDLLDVSRISRGKIELRKTPVELARVIHQAVESVDPLVEANGHALSVQVPTDPIVAEADEARLVQVVGNLLHNACKFTPPRGRIRVSLESGEGEAIIRVQDSGKGIAPDRFSRIFDMFAQADSPLDRTHNGLGIGLTLAQSLTALHDGTIEVRSAGPGRGSEFEVRLPVRPTPIAAAEVSAEPAPVVPARRILVVDDNVDSADSLAALLGLSGHETLTAYDGLEALQKAQAFDPDVILLDIGLPKLNGYEAALELRARAGGDRVLLIAITGWGQNTDRQKSAEAGFDVHLVKPVDHDALAKLLAEHRADGKSVGAR